jgi:hypothetical protein
MPLRWTRRVLIEPTSTPNDMPMASQKIQLPESMAISGANISPSNNPAKELFVILSFNQSRPPWKEGLPCSSGALLACTLPFA